MNAYGRCKEFSLIKALTAELVRPGDEWREGCPQDDDVTFVVLKLK